MFAKSKKSLASTLAFGAVVGMAAITGGASTAHAIPIDGASEGRHRVEANRTHIYNVIFRGGEQATVAVFGDSTTDLDIFVFDDRGRLVVSATDASDREWVRFTPRFTGSYRVEVRNLGNIWNAYRFVLN